MAVEYLTNEERAAQLTARLHELAPHHSGAWFFQLVVRAKARDKLPTRGSVELIRLLDRRALTQQH